MSAFRQIGLCRWVLGQAIVVLACLGCGDDGDRWEPRLVVAHGTMEGVARLAAEPEMRIDGYEADLVPINWLGATRDGTVVILQSQDYVVRFFDRSGTLIRTVGREGEGPGEFRSLGQGGWRADTLWVSDPRLARVTLISPEGVVLRTLPRLTVARPLPEDSSLLPTFYFVFPNAVYEGDSILVLAMGEIGDPLAEALDGTPLLRMSPDGWIGRLVTVLSTEGTLYVTYANGIQSVRIPFYPRPQWAVSPDGRRIATVTTDVRDSHRGSITVTVIDQEGEDTFRREIPIEGVPIPSQVVDSALQASAANVRRPEIRRAYETDIPDLVPPMYPPVEQLVVGNDHRVWIGLRPTPNGRPWLVLDAAGAPAGIVMLPVNSWVRTADAGYIWTVERDEFDVESVVRHRLD